MKEIFYLSIMLMLFACGNNEISPQLTSDKTIFVWDFSQPKTYIYSYIQTVQSKNNMGTKANITSVMEGTGKLKIEVKENGLADMKILDMQLSMITNFGDGPSSPIHQNAPPIIIQDISIDGNFQKSDDDMMYKLILPLPSRDIEKGQTDRTPVHMPFSAGSSRLKVKGEQSLYFKNYETIDNHKCAVLTGKINISKIDIPKELEGSYTCNVTGTGTYYFDVEQHYFIKAETDLIMDISVKDMPMPKEMPADMQRSNMSMYSKNHFTIKFEGIE